MTMEFREGAHELYAITHTRGEVEVLRERVKYIAQVLEQRSGSNAGQKEIVRAAISAVRRYLDTGQTSGHEREMLMRALYQLEMAGNIEVHK
jgi:hypothetical protein